MVSDADDGHRYPSRTVRFAVVDPDEPDAARLRRAMEDEADSLYADREGSIHTVSASPDEMRRPAGAFLVALAGRRGDRLRRLQAPRRRDLRDQAHVSRARLARPRPLAAPARGDRGEASAAGYRMARLDTGDRQPSAKHLYETAGYREIADYNGNTVARHWFEREL